MAKNINGLFETLTPNQEQKDKLFIEIESSIYAVGKDNRSRPTYFVKLLKPVAAVVVCAIVIGSVCITVNAVTNGGFFSYVKHAVFQDGAELEIHYMNDGEYGAAAAKVPEEVNWLVTESAQQRLLLQVNEESIDITDAMDEKGYYYHEFVYDDDLLHRIYIVKNGGEDETERWYSQIEYIPESKVSSKKGCSYTLGVVIAFVQSDVEDGLGTLDSELPAALALYWEVAETEEGTTTDLWNIIDARWGEWRD